MTVEILQSDSPEQIAKKLKSMGIVFPAKRTPEQIAKAEELKKLFGCLKLDFDPVEWQRKIRDEWDDRVALVLTREFLEKHKNTAISVDLLNDSETL